MTKLSTNESYRHLLSEIKEQIGQAQMKAVVSVNQHLVHLYWHIGKMIVARQQKEGWGTKVIDQLAKDLKKSFPDMKGFSKTNLKYMRQFADSYETFSIGQVPLDQISWYHNITLLQKCPDHKERLWYAQKAIEYGWSRTTMVFHIDSHLYEREGKALSNFATTLPKPQSEMAQQAMKDPYILDFLNLKKEALEKEIEDALVTHITKFLLELGKGFAFVGRQYVLSVGKSDYRIDLLFYHLQLRSYIAIEIKTTSFEPEYAGKMNFYLASLDKTVKSEHDNPSIGLILCKDKEQIKVEYTLGTIDRPIGVSEYLTEALPKELESNLPTIEELERELQDVQTSDTKDQQK